MVFPLQSLSRVIYYRTLHLSLIRFSTFFVTAQIFKNRSERLCVDIISNRPIFTLFLLTLKYIFPSFFLTKKKQKVKTAEKYLENYGTVFRRCERSADTDKWFSWFSDCPQLEAPKTQNMHSQFYSEPKTLQNLRLRNFCSRAIVWAMPCSQKFRFFCVFDSHYEFPMHSLG